MKVQPIASPTAIQQAPTNEAVVKARAVAAFTSAGSQQPPQQIVGNQNNIAPEEMGAIQAQTRQDDNTEATQEDTTEVAATEITKPVEDPALSRQFAQLARQEKALRAKAQQQEQALRTREAALAAREAELTSKSSQQQTDLSRYISRDQFKQDPLSALAEAGVSYEEITNQIINQQPVDPRLRNQVNELKMQIEELRQANEQSKKSQADNQTQAYQAAVKQIRMDVTNLVNSDPTFETIKVTGSVRDVVDLIEQTYHKDGILLSVEDAASQVEEYLVEESIKLANINKIKQRMMQKVAPKASSTTAQTPAANQKQPQPMKTLTNATSSSRQLSAKERAILAFKGELKS